MPLNEIEVGRFNGIVRKLLSIPEGAPSPMVATEVFPVLPLESDRPEWKFLGGERLCSVRHSDPAVAGQTSNVGLRNPAGSGVLVVVELVNVSQSGGLFLLGLRQGGVTDNLFTGVARDTRFGGPGATQMDTTARVFDLTQVAALTAGVFGTSFTSQYDVRVPFVLSPGWDLFVRPNAVNLQIIVSFVWRERALEPSETR